MGVEASFEQAVVIVALCFIIKNHLTMATKQRISKQRQNTKEQDEMRKFLLIVVGATLALMVLMYFIFR